MDKHYISALVLLDFTKAFQSVDHEILLAKLKSNFKFKSAPVTWMRSYLTGRSQSIRCNDSRSPWAPLSCGVSQGTVLAPILFAMYLNDLSQHIHHLNFHFYADDVQVYISTHPAQLINAINLINSDLCRINSWAIANGLQINPNKSQCTLIGSKRIVSKLNLAEIPQIRVQNSPLLISKTVKNLGILFDTHFSWTDHVNQVCKKAFAALHSLQRLKNILPSSIKSLLVQSLVLTQIDYCNGVYVNICNNEVRKLQRVENACVRFIFNLKRYDHVSPYFQDLGWLDFSNRRTYHALVILFKVMLSKSPEYLLNRFCYVRDTHSFNTRSNRTTDLTIPVHKTNHFTNSFTLHSIRNWNEIPHEIRQSTSVQEFKKKLKEFFLRKRISK